MNGNIALAIYSLNNSPLCFENSDLELPNSMYIKDEFNLTVY